MSDDIFNLGLFSNLRKFINIIDELRDLGVQEYINLPRIAVIGTQSAGKSSLLESVVGLDFLPRGDGVVTRRPLEMRLVHVPEQNGKPIQPVAVFEELKNEKFTDFDIVRDKINELTDKKAGKTKNIINDPIIVTIRSSTCPDLTMIDLPGITRVPLPGQDEKIEEITKNMSNFYIKDDRTIILCVIPANQDMSTSDAIQMARLVDKEGSRTIGVITKIDIMDKGSDALKMVIGEDIPLKLGYVAVKNRSQFDINNKMRVRKALEEESEWFANHPIYSKHDQSYFGSKALIIKLTNVLHNHIKKHLPTIIAEINNKVKECEQRLKEMGPTLPADPREKMHHLWKMITEFTDSFKNCIKGKFEGGYVASEMAGGAIIRNIFYELYGDYVGDYRASTKYSDSEIEEAINLHQGDSIPGFPSIDSFLYLIQPNLENLKAPAFKCLDDVFDYLDELLSKLVDRKFSKIPAISGDVADIAYRTLQEEKERARVVVESLIDAELGYLFTNDLDYLTNRTNILPKVDNEKGKELTNPNAIFIKELRERIDSYFYIVTRNLRDAIPKSVGFYMVKGAQDKMQYALYNQIIKNAEIMEKLEEPSHIALERDRISKTLTVLKRAQKSLSKDPEYQ